MITICDLYNPCRYKSNVKMTTLYVTETPQVYRRLAALLGLESDVIAIPLGITPVALEALLSGAKKPASALVCPKDKYTLQQLLTAYRNCFCIEKTTANLLKRLPDAERRELFRELRKENTTIRFVSERFLKGFAQDATLFSHIEAVATTSMNRREDIDQPLSACAKVCTLLKLAARGAISIVQ